MVVHSTFLWALLCVLCSHVHGRVAVGFVGNGYLARSRAVSLNPSICPRCHNSDVQMFNFHAFHTSCWGIVGGKRAGLCASNGKNNEDADDNDITKQAWDTYDSTEGEKRFKNNEKGGWDDGVFKIPAKNSGAGVFGAAIARPPPPPMLELEDMTEELRDRVLRVSIDAMDNFPPQEVDRKLGLLWAAGPAAGPEGRSIRRLVGLTEEIENIENEAIRRVKRAGADLYDLEDAIRAARSRVRMYLKDSDYYDPDSWLSLDRNELTKDGVDPWSFKFPWQK